jgi:GT2 family glycosyltransferase
MLVSVVIPTFNRRRLVREAVASACAQHGAECEIVVVDDGSTDGTAAALQNEFGTRIRVLRTANRGVAASRNLGVAASRGGLIAFLDSDDLGLPGKLAAQIAFFAAHPEAEICQTEEIWIRNGVRVNPRAHHRKRSGDIFEPSLRLCLVSPSAVMLRRELFERVGGFDERLPVCEDYDLWLRIARDTPVWLIDRPLVIKRGGHADQLSRRFWGMDRFRVAALTRLLEQDHLTPAQRQATLSVLADKCAILAKGAARRGRQVEAKMYAALPDRIRNSPRVFHDDAVGFPLPPGEGQGEGVKRSADDAFDCQLQRRHGPKVEAIIRSPHLHPVPRGEEMKTSLLSEGTENLPPRQT